jgi:hypothetical protein
MENLVNTVIELQLRINRQIDAYGQADINDVDEVVRLCDILTPEQADELMSRMFENNIFA